MLLLCIVTKFKFFSRPFFIVGFFSIFKHVHGFQMQSEVRVSWFFALHLCMWMIETCVSNWKIEYCNNRSIVWHSICLWERSKYTLDVLSRRKDAMIEDKKKIGKRKGLKRTCSQFYFRPIVCSTDSKMLMMTNDNLTTKVLKWSIRFQIKKKERQKCKFVTKLIRQFARSNSIRLLFKLTHSRCFYQRYRTLVVALDHRLLLFDDDEKPGVQEGCKQPYISDSKKHFSFS